MPLPKDSPPEAPTPWRRYLIAAGTARYIHLPDDAQLPSVERDIERVKRAFAEMFRYRDAVPALEINPTRDGLIDAVEWFMESERNEHDVVILYYSGHGDVEGNQHFLLTSDAVPTNLLRTAIQTEYFARRIGSSSVRLVLIFLDTCYSGYGAGEIQQVVTGMRDLFTKENVGIFVIAAARPKEEAAQGAFVEALQEAFRNPSLAGERQPYIYPSSLSPAINRFLKKRELHQSTTLLITYSGVEDPPFLPNPRYKPNIPIGVDLKTQRRLGSMDPRERATHWEPRARGVEAGTQPGWYFTGRNRVLSELVHWLRTPSAEAKPRVITGRPGIGKSAVLARLVTLADPDFRIAVPQDSVPSDTLPPESSINIAVHAKGKTVAEVTRAISSACDLNTDDPRELAKGLEKREKSFTVVVDALDEAQEPDSIARNVLRPLTPLASVRLLIGTRPGPIPALGPHVVTTDLGEERYHDINDLEEFISRRLLAEDEPDVQTPYRDNPSLAREVADTVAKKADPIFLIARLIAEELIQTGETVDPRDPAWREHLPMTVDQAFANYLARFGLEEQMARDLLLPLAYAEGEGLPWEHLWAPVASALSGYPYTDDDVAWVLDKAGAYVVEALDGGRSVYRLYHQALTDYLRDPDLDAVRHRHMAEALLAGIPDRDEVGNKAWREAHPYVVQHLSTHAMIGRTLAELVRDPYYLIVADPYRLVRAMEQSRASLPDDVVHVYLQCAHRLRTDALEENTSYLELYSTTQGATELRERIQQLPLVRKWSTRWARCGRASVHRVLEGHDGGVNSVAVGAAGGRCVIVSGSFDKTVRVWDAESGEHLRVLEDHEGAIDSVAVGEVGGRAVVVSGSWDETVRVWSAETGEPLLVLQGHDDVVNSVAVGEVGGHAVIVSGSYDKTVRVWNAETGEPLLVLQGHDDVVNSVAVGEVGGHAVIVSGSYDKTVRVWSAETGAPLHVLEGHDGAIGSVALGEVGGRVVIVSASYETVRVWDLQTGGPCGMLKGHENFVNSVAVGEIGGRAVIVSGSNDRMVRLWNAKTGELLRVFEGHDGKVSFVAIGEVGDRAVIVSGSNDRTARVWDAESGEPQLKREGNYVKVNSVAVGEVGGRAVVVSGSWDETVRVWNAETGEFLRVLQGHDDVVNSVAVGEVGGGTVIVSGSHDKTVRVWNAETGEPLRVLEGHEGEVSSVAVGEVGGHAAIVSGGEDATVRLWDAETGELLRVLGGHDDSVSSVVIGGVDGRRVIASGGGDGSVRVWDAETGEPLHVLEGHEGVVSSVAVGEVCGRAVIVSGCYDGTVRVWDVQTGEPIGILEGHAYEIFSVAVGRVGRRIVIVSGSDDQTVRVWDAELGRTLPEREAEPLSLIRMGVAVESVACDRNCILIGATAGIVSLELNDSALFS